MKKSDREKIFNKYGGKCAYCGCDLKKGWHVDEFEPVRRNYKRVRGNWSEGYHPDITEQEIVEKGIKWVPERTVFNGYEHPERLHIDNQNPACASCNILKSSQSIEGFRLSIAGFINSLNSYINQYKIAKRYGLVKETEKPVVFYFETFNQ